MNKLQLLGDCQLQWKTGSILQGSAGFATSGTKIDCEIGAEVYIVTCNILYLHWAVSQSKPNIAVLADSQTVINVLSQGNVL